MKFKKDFCEEYEIMYTDRHALLSRLLAYKHHYAKAAETSS